MATDKSDAMLVISALKEDLDYHKVGEAIFALLCLSDDYLEGEEWPQCEKCCDELEQLAKDPDLQRTADIDTTYVRGIAQFYRGAMLLGRDRPKDAGPFFSNSQQLFHDASASHSEAVALLALGIAYQEERLWTETLKALQCSLSIFRKLQDRHQVDVRERLVEVRQLLRQDWDTEKSPTKPKAVPPSPAATKRRGRIIPIVGETAAGDPVLVQRLFLAEGSMPDEETLMGLVEENIIEDYIYADNEIAEKADLALTVEGESMIEAGILKGDVVLIERTNAIPSSGRIVVASPDQDKGTTLKACYDNGDHILLKPANQDYAFIICGPTGLEESELRDRYGKSHPGRELDIHLGSGAQIHGWARALIRRRVR